jgi:AcrR family transcriptional regulator
VPALTTAPARLRLLDAARELLREQPWETIRMADVAARAGVSRQTLYKELGSREELAQAFVLREADRFLETVSSAVAAHAEDPQAALTAGFDVFLAAASEDPLVRAVVFGGAGELLALFTTQGRPVVQRAAEQLAEIIAATWPQIATTDAELLAEALVRLGISYAALPAGPANLTGDSVTRLLGPFLRKTLGDPLD